jgi:hypothetical protein
MFIINITIGGVMRLSKIYKNKFVQGASFVMVAMFVAGGIANAASLCLPTTISYCEVRYWDSPYKTPGYWDIDSQASVKCNSTKRVAIEHKLQKKNTLGIWIDVKNPGYIGGTLAASTKVHVDCTNDKTTTWRTVTKVVLNYGAYSWSGSSLAATYPCGT